MSAVSEGISDQFAFYLLSIANACSAVGRITGGLAADRTGVYFRAVNFAPRSSHYPLAGPLNVMTPATLIAGIMTYIWPFATSVGGNIGVAIVYGFVLFLTPVYCLPGFLNMLTSPLRVYNRASSGVYVSLLTAPIVRMSKTQEVGVRAGMSMTLVALSAIAGPPISGAINGLTGGFKFTGVYAGALFPPNARVSRGAYRCHSVIQGRP